MDEAAKLAPFPLVGDADPVPPSLFASYPEQANTLSLLYEVSREITSILDREELLRRVAQRVKKLVNYHVFSVMLWNEKTQLLESAFVMRYGDAIPARMRVPLNQGLTGTAAGQRRAVRVADTRADPRFLGCEVETGVAVRSELVVPLLMQDRLIGVLDLESAETHAFTAEHERMLATLASYVAIALENARLYEEARQGRREAQVLADLTGTINASLDLDTVLQQIADGARELCQSDLARIARRRSTTTEMLITHWSGARSGRADDHPIESGRGIEGLVLDTGRPFRTDNCRADPRINEDSVAVADAEGTIAEMVVPIRVGRRIEGLLYVGNRCHRPFTDRDEATLLRLADHVAVAIRNGRLFEEAERRR